MLPRGHLVARRHRDTLGHVIAVPAFNPSGAEPAVLAPPLPAEGEGDYPRKTGTRQAMGTILSLPCTGCRDGLADRGLRGSA